MPRTVLFSGLDIRAAEVPDDARVLFPPAPLPALSDFEAALKRALDAPVSGEPLRRLAAQSARGCVVVDDLSLPVPPPARDVRPLMLAAVLEQVRGRPTVLIANGLSRQWRPAELAEVFGKGACVRCHDAEAFDGLVRVGDEPEGPVELNRALAEADLVVHLNVVSLPLLAGSVGVISGAVGYRTARWLNAPKLLDGSDNPLAPGSAFARAHERVAAHVLRRVPVFQVSVVLNNQLWPPPVTALFRSASLSRPLQMWNALPDAVRHRAARVLRGGYEPISVLAGPPDAVGPRSLEAFRHQNALAVDGEADILVFGLPDQGPATARSRQNPILAAHLALGCVASFSTGRPLLKPGGVIVFANPLSPTFDRKAHPGHEELFERVFPKEREPEALAEEYEPYFAGRPELVSAYRKRFAFHGAHALHAWYLCTPARRRAGRILVAHGDPGACERLGFGSAPSVEHALQQARAFLGQPRPQVTVLGLPPPLWVTVR